MTHSFPTRRSSDLQVAIRQAVEAICANYPPEYWLKCDSEERFPEEFYADMVAGGYVGLTLPEECGGAGRSEEHTSELQSLMRISYAGFCLKKKKNHKVDNTDRNGKYQSIYSQIKR